MPGVRDAASCLLRSRKLPPTWLASLRSQQGCSSNARWNRWHTLAVETNQSVQQLNTRAPIIETRALWTGDVAHSRFVTLVCQSVNAQ